MDPSMATIGEQMAGTSRVNLMLKGALVQILVGGLGSVWGYAFQAGDPLFYTSVPWRLLLLVSCFAYLSVFVLIRWYIPLFLPRTPVAVDEALQWVGTFVAGVVFFTLAAVLGSRVQDGIVVVGCTCFVALLIAGLLVVWAGLVREYGGEEASEDMCTEKQCEVTTMDNYRLPL